MKKPEFGKIIAVMSTISSFILSGIIVYCTFHGIECGNLTTVTCLAWAETAASNVAYYSKVKKENLPKTIIGIYKGLPRDLKAQVDINSLMNSLMN